MAQPKASNAKSPFPEPTCAGAAPPTGNYRYAPPPKKVALLLPGPTFYYASDYDIRTDPPY